MSVSPVTHTAEEQGSKPAKRYRVVRGDLPTNLVDVVSSAHAAALAYTTAHALALDGNELSAPELDEAGEDRSPTGSEGEVHHE